MVQTELSRPGCWESSIRREWGQTGEDRGHFPVYNIMFRGRLNFKMRCFHDRFPLLTWGKGSLGWRQKGRKPLVWAACQEVCDTTASLQATFPLLTVSHLSPGPYDVCSLGDSSERRDFSTNSTPGA